MNYRTLLPFALVLAVVAFAHGAAAQTNTGFSVDRFEPSERGSEWFVLDTLDLRGHVRPALGIVADYAYKPLVFYDKDGNEVHALIQNQLFLHVGASLVLWERLRLAFNLPIAAVVDGNGGTLSNGTVFDAKNGANIGDLRLSADVRLFGEYGGVITGAIGVSVFAPTGSQDAYTGDGKVRIAPHLMIAGDLGPFVYGARAGFTYRAEHGDYAGTAIGSEILWAVSAGFRVADKKLVIGPEIYGSSVVEDGVFKPKGSPIEGVFGLHYLLPGDFRLGVGAGPGFNKAFGTPKVRVVGSLEWVPQIPPPPPPPPSDRDHDGIIDPEDACPDEPGPRNADPKKNGCPLRDRDGDHILDEDDACPDEPGPPNEDPLKNGCPLHDRDGDHILDEDDACPDLPGPASSDPEKNGCPDTDGDNIIDPKDACPTVPGPPNEDPKKNGCPLARIEHGQVRILEQVQFAFNSDRILHASDVILNAVLKIVEEHDEITRISIEGHTDNVGSAKYNKDLSNRRAASVRNWLVQHGVDAGRLSSVGYGLERPIADNVTEEGRQENRRVEFHIKEIHGKAVDENKVDEQIEDDSSSTPAKGSSSSSSSDDDSSSDGDVDDL
jgi:outer membrane protein OmpA-like peptidoglycan-associated protein